MARVLRVRVILHTFNQFLKSKSISTFSLRLSSFSYLSSCFSTSTSCSSILLKQRRSLHNETPYQRYNARIAQGQWRFDERQEAAINKLEELYQCLLANPNVFEPPSRTMKTESSTTTTTMNKNEKTKIGGLIGGLLKSFTASSVQHANHNTLVEETQNLAPPRWCRGIYIYGGVGSGKTMLMDTFYEAVPTHRKRRTHFHSFMLEVHERLFARKEHEQDPLTKIAHEIAEQSRVICLDEFQVTDVADAMILKTLFTTIFGDGAVVVCTSNRPPDDLYKNGINREVFLPFIDVLKHYCKVYQIPHGQDHRMEGTLVHGVWINEHETESERKIEESFVQLAKQDGNATAVPTEIQVMMGRTLKVQKATKHVAIFTFEELCDRNLGAADYIALAARFEYIIMTHIPQLSMNYDRNRLRRFITFLDIMYEECVRVIFGAAAPIDEIIIGASRTPELQKGGVAAVQDEAFAAGRALSRLYEMTSQEYAVRCAEKRDAIVSAA